jgi:hypothetical protein
VLELCVHPAKLLACLRAMNQAEELKILAVSIYVADLQTKAA